MQWEIQGRWSIPHLWDCPMFKIPTLVAYGVLFLNKEPSISIYSMWGPDASFPGSLVHTKSGTSKCIAKFNTNYLALPAQKDLFLALSMFP